MAGPNAKRGVKSRHSLIILGVVCMCLHNGMTQIKSTMTAPPAPYSQLELAINAGYVDAEK